MVREKRKQFAHSQNVQKTDIGQAGAGTGANEWQHHCRCHEHDFVTWESQPALQCPSLYPAPLALYALCMYGWFRTVFKTRSGRASHRASLQNRRECNLVRW